MPSTVLKDHMRGMPIFILRHFQVDYSHYIHWCCFHQYDSNNSIILLFHLVEKLWLERLNDFHMTVQVFSTFRFEVEVREDMFEVLDLSTKTRNEEHEGNVRPTDKT